MGRGVQTGLRKMQSKTTWTTVKTQDGTHTTDIVSTMEHMMEYFIPNDSNSSGSAHHTHIRHEIDTPDDVELTKKK